MPGRGENLHDYLIPTIGDVPPIESILIECASAVGPFGAKGIGEQALIPTAPAILNAIHHATGVRITRTPATPDRVRAAIKAMERRMTEAQQDKIRCDACPVLCYIRRGACRAPATATPTRAAGSCASIRTSCSNARWRRAARLVPFLDRGEDWDGSIVARALAPSSPPSAPARPIPTTSPRPSSSRPRSTASTWSPSSPRASSATAASR